jgi:hypothetical protein
MYEEETRQYIVQVAFFMIGRKERNDTGIHQDR